MEKAKVYFTKNLTSESLIKLYKKANCHLEGKVAIRFWPLNKLGTVGKAE